MSSKNNLLLQLGTETVKNTFSLDEFYIIVKLLFLIYKQEESLVNS